MQDILEKALMHSWGKSPKQKAREKEYNAEYYRKNKEKWQKESANTVELSAAVAKRRREALDERSSYEAQRSNAYKELAKLNESVPSSTVNGRTVVTGTSDEINNYRNKKAALEKKDSGS